MHHKNSMYLDMFDRYFLWKASPMHYVARSFGAYDIQLSYCTHVPTTPEVFWDYNVMIFRLLGIHNLVYSDTFTACYVLSMTPMTRDLELDLP